MNVTTISMDRQQARRAYLDYRAAVRARHDEEDAAIMRGYRELAKGHEVLNLHDAMSEAGVCEQGRPRLAICRADERRVVCEIPYEGGRATFGWGGAIQWNSIKDRPARRDHVRTPLPGARRQRGRNGGGMTLHGVVPNIPPALRPSKGLHLYHVLWEVESWEAVPVDPMLLRHLGGALYAVLAVWDLTELERAVLAGTRALN